MKNVITTDIGKFEVDISSIRNVFVLHDDRITFDFVYDVIFYPINSELIVRGKTFSYDCAKELIKLIKDKYGILINSEKISLFDIKSGARIYF